MLENYLALCCGNFANLYHSINHLVVLWTWDSTMAANHLALCCGNVMDPGQHNEQKVYI